MARKLSIVIVGAHPDDCEWAAGGITVLYRQLGHRVTYIHMTNGDAGHHAMTREQLKARRHEETRKVAEYLDVDFEIMDNHDGGLEPTLQNREALIRLLRKYEPDVVISHPLDDYHPDHRYTGQLVLDTGYMLGVPLCVPDAPPVKKDIVYCHVSFKPEKDVPATIIVPVDEQLDKKINAFHLNTSQVYEWLPWTENIPPEKVPADEQGRLEFLKKWALPIWGKITENYRNQLNSHLGPEKAAKIKQAEVFAASFCGSPLTPENAREYFPFPEAIIC